MLRFSDARNFGRTLTGLLLIAAPTLMLIANAIQPDTDHSNKLQELNAVAAHKGIYLLSGIVFLIGGVCVIGVGAGLLHLFRGSGGVTAGQVAGALLMLAGMVTAGWYTFGAVEYEMVNHSGLDRQALANFLDKASDGGASVLPLIILFMVGLVIGMILLAVANWRTRLTPLWVSAVIVIGGIINAFADSRVINIVSSLILLVGFGAIGLRVLGMSDEEWDQPRDRALRSQDTATASPAEATG